MSLPTFTTQQLSRAVRFFSEPSTMRDFARTATEEQGTRAIVRAAAMVNYAYRVGDFGTARVIVNGAHELLTLLAR